MQIKYQLLLIILFCYSLQTYAQLCEGNLGDPVVSIDFGSGTARGSALGSDITAFTYSGSGELDEGEYTIANTTSGLKGNAWHVTSDHTGDTNGHMMVINSAVLANEGVFYTKTVTGLCANTTFEFSAWLINLMNPSVGTDEYHPDVTFRISDTSGNILGSYNTGDIAQSSSGIWQQYGFFFTLEAETEVIITILNSAPSAHPGNDIALDDIAFKPCGPTITSAIENETSISLDICEGENVSYTFQSVVSSGYSDPQYQWQYSDDSGTSWIDIIGETTPDYIFTNTGQSGTFLYRLAVANGTNINSLSCRITSDEYTIEILETPDPLTGDSEQFFCTTQQPTVNDIEVSATAIWYDSAINGNVIDTTTALIDGTIYYGAQATSNGCESDERFAVLATINSPSLIINAIEASICDTDNDLEETIDLTVFEPNIVDCEDCIFSYYLNLSDAENDTDEQRISTPENYNWSSETIAIYARIDSPDQCFQTAEIIITLEETPIILIDDYIGICENENYTTIDAGYGFDTYLWSTGETTRSINITSENLGLYDVTVTENHVTYNCSTTKEFEVILSNNASISSIAIKDWSDSNNSITVYLSDSSLGNYEYSIDDISYQDNNTFSGLSPGEYTVYVRDKNGCGITQEVVYLLNYPKYFTPNNDGNHDTWFIDNSYLEPNMTIQIFDRYGKLLKLMNYNSHWDGTYNGNKLPTSDYWFLVTREDGRSYAGHFTLKR
ncbi:T9SS type B sorting domain-containing protein [Winogradskyella psychrotolerans]|uniref:T9SS type B sorting domain-containing protein n=1 Tax=Winogradskyella psychrotolerans TaxID=1344585 RepID=UPI001C07AC12|nr:T9SS type B sorting domain-containing protein [Winogradskyella psychrotolerans]MBU2928552.1 T9SS type B sorting domain-containing protein [Winogradskyella psychrotolerans]